MTGDNILDSNALATRNFKWLPMLNPYPPESRI
jgi:hypothetical protein